MIITLMGFMGSGKSSIGRRLSKQLNIKLYDLDDHIVDKEGMTINEIFAKEGEAHFRELEYKYLKKLIKNNKKAIIALGGGTPCQEKNWKQIEKTLSVYLCRSEDYLFENLKEKKEKRPLIKDLNDEQLRELISTKLATRRVDYEKADIIVDVDLPKGEMTKTIAEAIKMAKG